MVPPTGTRYKVGHTHAQGGGQVRFQVCEISNGGGSTRGLPRDIFLSQCAKFMLTRISCRTWGGSTALGRRLLMSREAQDKGYGLAEVHHRAIGRVQWASFVRGSQGRRVHAHRSDRDNSQECCHNNFYLRETSKGHMVEKTVVDFKKSEVALGLTFVCLSGACWLSLHPFTDSPNRVNNPL